MSWVDKYTHDLIITTGDEETFTLATLPSFSKEIEYHTQDFSFVNIDGELVKKRKIKGRTFPLEFYFIGENHLDEAASFEFSASHPSPWTVTHPYYDTLLVQVSSIKFDDTDGNVTKVTCIAKETIQDGTQITTTLNVADFIELKKIEIDSIAVAEPELTPTIAETDNLKALTEKNYKAGVKIIQNPIDAENYFNAFQQANAAVDNLTATPIIAIQALINIVTAPAQFQAKVQDRIKVLLNQFDNLRRTLSGLYSVTSKKLYHIQGTSLINAMCQAAGLPQPSDYKDATAANTIAQSITTAYKLLLVDLSSIQGDNSGNRTSFIPSFDLSRLLADQVYFTSSNLLDIALDGRKQMTFVLGEDSNVILLTHRFYRMDVSDENINEFISINKIRYKEIALGISKGRTVFYYA